MTTKITPCFLAVMSLRRMVHVLGILILDVIIMCGRKDIFINLDENISFITKFNNDRNFVIKENG